MSPYFPLWNANTDQSLSKKRTGAQFIFKTLETSHVFLLQYRIKQEVLFVK